MTTPFNPVIPAGHVPPVAPIYFAQGPSSAELLQHSFDQLMRTMQNKQELDLTRQAQTFKEQQMAKGDQNDADLGSFLQQLYPAQISTDSTPQKMARIGTVIQSANPATVGRAAKTIGPLIGQDVKLTAPEPPAKPVGSQIDGKTGYVYNVFADGSTKQRMAPDGKTPLVARTVDSTIGAWKPNGVDPETGNIKWHNFATGQDYIGGYKGIPGAIKESQQTKIAAGYLRPMLDSYTYLNDIIQKGGALDMDPVNYIGAARVLATGKASNLMAWFSQNNVSAHDRAIIEALLPVAVGIAHSQGSRRMSNEQIQQYLTMITPFKNDAEITFSDGTNGIQRKDRLMRQHIVNLYDVAGPSVAGDIPDLHSQWPELSHFMGIGAHPAAAPAKGGGGADAQLLERRQSWDALAKKYGPDLTTQRIGPRP